MRYEDIYRRSIEHPQDFWREQARQIGWFREPEEILSQDGEDLYVWFRGGKLNTAYLALDYHVEQGRGNQTALIYDSPVTDVKDTYTYDELRDEVARFASVLRQFGVSKGDTVIIYMPMIPQTIIGMLACARIGAIHSVVFGGFAPHELAVRIDDTHPKVLLTASCGKEVDRLIDYQQIVNAALAEAVYPPPTCVVYQRDIHRVDLQPDREGTSSMNVVTRTRPRPSPNVRSEGSALTSGRLVPIRGPPADHDFWEMRSDGLALFLDGQSLRRYRVPLRLDELAVVNRRFHVKPLVPLRCYRMSGAWM